MTPCKHSDERGTVFWAVLAVLLVASLLFSSVVLYGSWHQAQNRLMLYRMQARYMAEAALANAQSFLASQGEPVMALVATLSDSITERQSWTAVVSPWGCYLRALCTGNSHQATERIDVLLGRISSPEFDYVLRLFGPPYPLVVAGQTRVNGNVNVGPGGISSGQYRGRDRIDTILVYGNVVADPAPQPIPIDWQVWEEFTERANAIRAATVAQSDRALIIDDEWKLDPDDSVVVIDAPVSFSRTLSIKSIDPIYLFASGPIAFSGNAHLDGRWVIRSDRSITVQDSAEIAGVVLWAPRIDIAGNVRFSGQAIADTLLELKGNAQTLFPTLLWVTGNTGQVGKSMLRLRSARWCEGIAGLSGMSSPWEWMYGSEQSGELLVDSLARWRGYLYVNGKVELRGSVAGSVNAELLVVEDPPTTYLNWILDAWVSRPAWRGAAALPAILRNGDRWEVAEYLEIQRPKDGAERVQTDSL